MKRRAPDGFTLLEMLLAISLIALITGSIMGGLHLGRRAWETTRASEALDEVENAARGVTGLIGRSYLFSTEQQQSGPTPPPGQQQQQLRMFQGAPEACRFVMLSEGGAQWGGLILTEIGGEPGNESVELAVWTRVFRLQEGFGPSRGDMRKTVLLRNIASFELAYFGSPEEGRPPVWSAAWTNPKRMPTLVSVKIAANRLGRVIQAAATVAIREP